jgi:hypothetical protein
MLNKYIKRLLVLSKQHKKVSIITLIAIVVSIGVPAKIIIDKRADAARNRYFGEQRHLELVRGCEAKVGKNTIDQVYGSWDYERNRYSLKIEASVAADKTPEVYVDDEKIEFDTDLVSEDIKFSSGYACEWVQDKGSYYSLTVTMPATCNEKKAKIKTSDYELAARVDNNGRECKSKEQQEAEKKAQDEKEAKEKLEKDQREAEEARRKAEEKSRELSAQKPSDSQNDYMLPADISPYDIKARCERYAESKGYVGAKIKNMQTMDMENGANYRINGTLYIDRGITSSEQAVGSFFCVVDYNTWEITSATLDRRNI